MMIHQNQCQNNNDSPSKFLVKYPLKWQFPHAHHPINWCYNFRRFILCIIASPLHFTFHITTNIHFNQLHFMFVVFVVIVPLLPKIRMVALGHEEEKIKIKIKRRRMHIMWLHLLFETIESVCHFGSISHTIRYAGPKCAFESINRRIRFPIK